MPCRYKLVYCRKCDTEHIIDNKIKGKEAVIRCRICRASSRLYRKVGGKPANIVILYESNDMDAVKTVYKDRQISIEEQSMAIFNTYQIKK